MTFENKKFLDKIGIAHLWEKIENQFINSEELNVVIEAIDEVKADKTDLENAINKIEERVEKEEGKGLSTNDFTDEYKNKVDYTVEKLVNTEEEDAMELLYDAGVIAPTTDNDGSVLTDENGNIFII